MELIFYFLDYLKKSFQKKKKKVKTKWDISLGPMYQHVWWFQFIYVLLAPNFYFLFFWVGFFFF